MARLKSADIELPDELEAYAREQVEAGVYGSRSELLAEAIELLRERNKSLGFDTGELRRAVSDGLTSGPGRFQNIDEIKAEGRRRLTAEMTKTLG